MGTVTVPIDVQVLLRGSGCHAALRGNQSGVKLPLSQVGDSNRCLSGPGRPAVAAGAAM